MNADLPRRGFLGLVAIGGAGWAIAGCGDDPAAAPTTTTVDRQPLVAEILTDDDATGWFTDPESVAALGAGRVGERLLGPCGIATPTTVATRGQLVAAIERERDCGSLVQLGGWFITPTEAAIAQEVAGRLGTR